MFRLFKTWLVLSVCLLASNAWAAPSLVVEQPVFDFGEVTQGQKVPHTFTFRNAGDEPLHIDKVSSSCGCTAALVSAETLAPGESGEVEATFDSTRFRGAVTKTITLYTNDPQRPVMKMSINGKIRVTLSVAPERINLGQIRTGSVAVAQVTLQNNGDAALRLDKVSTTSPDLVAKLSADRLPAGQSAVIDIQLTPTPGKNRFSGYVIIPAQGTIKSDLRIPVLASIQQKSGQEAEYGRQY